MQQNTCFKFSAFRCRSTVLIAWFSLPFVRRQTLFQSQDIPPHWLQALRIDALQHRVRHPTVHTADGHLVCKAGRHTAPERHRLCSLRHPTAPRLEPPADQSGLRRPPRDSATHTSAATWLGPPAALRWLCPRPAIRCSAVHDQVTESRCRFVCRVRDQINMAVV